MGVPVHLALEMQSPDQGGLRHDDQDTRRGAALYETAHKPAVFGDPNHLPQAVDVRRDVPGGVENLVKRERLN